MITTTGTLPPSVQQTMDDRLLSVMSPSLIHTLAATPKELPAKGGKTLRMARFQRLPTFPVPLGDSGAPIPATSVSKVEIDATMSFFGQFIAVNQQVVLQNNCPVLNTFAELLGLSLRMTEDQLTRDCMASTASAYTCTGGVNGDVPSNFAASDFAEVTAALLSNDAYMIFDRQEGENKFGTGCVRNAFVGLCHTDLSKDFDAFPGFLPKWNYPNANAKTVSSEWGAVNNIRFLLSSVGSYETRASGLGNTVYNLFIQGLESLGIVKQDNYTSRFLYRPAVYSDALFQNVTLGTVFAQVPRILNDLWLTKMRCTLNT